MGFNAATSRRKFFANTLAHTSVWVAGAGIGARSLRAIPLNRFTARTTPSVWFEEPPTPGILRSLATAAMDAATAAGAVFADIRIGEQRTFMIDTGHRIPAITSTFGYGIRALYEGTWGFMHGDVMTKDAVTAAARGAVVGAKHYSAVNGLLGGERIELVHTPVQTGEWSVPHQINPFAVPIDDHLRHMDALERTTEHYFQVATVCDFRWLLGTRVFASTDGALTTQQFTRGNTRIEVVTALPDEGPQCRLPVRSVWPMSAGYEIVLRPEIIDNITTTAEEAIRLSEIPQSPFDDVGRFPVVLDGTSVAELIGKTVNPALEADRVAGFEADASGTSYLVPPMDILSAPGPQFSPLLNLSVDRTVPSYTAVRWDDDGVPPEHYTVVEHGHVTDYHTTRETAGLFSEWYKLRGQSVRSRGCSIAEKPGDIPMPGGVHLTMGSATTPMNIDDLIRGMKHGFVVHGANVSVEPGLTTGLAKDGLFLEVKNGKRVARVRARLSVQFETQKLWKDALTAIGDQNTVLTKVVHMEKGMPWQPFDQVVSAPAVQYKEANIICVDVKL